MQLFFSEKKKNSLVCLIFFFWVIYWFLSFALELIFIERYNYLKREKRKRCIEPQEIMNLPSKEDDIQIMAFSETEEERVFVLSLVFLSGSASLILSSLPCRFCKVYSIEGFFKGVEMLVALSPNGTHLALNFNITSIHTKREKVISLLQLVDCFGQKVLFLYFLVSQNLRNDAVN